MPSLPTLPAELSANAASENRNQAPWRSWIHVMGIQRLAWLACCASIAVLAIVALLVRQGDQREFINALDTNLSQDAKGYAKFVALNLAIVDRQLTALREQHLQGQSLPAQAAINNRLPEINGLLLQVAVANADGQVVDSSLGMPNPPVSIADRLHFRTVKNNPEDSLFISQPVLGRVSKKPSLQLVRPMLAPDGRFLGAIVASIDPELLKTYFTDMKVLDNEGRLSIYGLDGIVRFRLTNQGFSAGQNIRETPQWGAVSTATVGAFNDKSIVDGIERRTGFHRVEVYPLVVAVGTGMRAQMLDLNARWNLIWCLALVLAAVLIVVAGTISRLAEEQQRSFGLLEQDRLRALESNRIKSNFLASVSHELRTPLNSILGFSELIRDISPDPQSSQYASLIHKSGTHLHALVNTIMDLAKIESGNMGLMLENIDMLELLGTLTSIHKVNADQKMLKLALSADGMLQCVVESDRTKLTQVLNNVVHNAIKFTQSGTILVVIKPAGEAGLLISVIDTGIGIPADVIGRVFDRFNTIDSRMDSASEKGSGLGLALCRELLSLMGGTISMLSEAGHGTTVNIYMPSTISKAGGAT